MSKSTVTATVAPVATLKAPKAPKVPALVAPVVTITVGLTPAQLAAGFAVGAKIVGLANLIGIDAETRSMATLAESHLFLTLAVLAPDSKSIKSDTVRDLTVKVNAQASAIDPVAFGDLLCKGRRIVRKLAESFDGRDAILAECERLLVQFGSMSAIRDDLFTAPAGDQQRKSVFTLTSDKIGDGKTFTVAELEQIVRAATAALTARKATVKVA